MTPHPIDDAAFAEREEALGRQLEQRALTPREHARELAQLRRLHRQWRIAASFRLGDARKGKWS